MHSNKRSLTLFLFFILILSSCTISKKRYGKGYNFDWITNSHTASNKKKKLERAPEKISLPQEKSEVLIAGNNYSEVIKFTRPKSILKDTCGDVVVLYSGEEIQSKVIEINDTEIKYKLCSNLGGPLIVVPKEQVFMIRYANGQKEVIIQKTPSSNANGTNNQNRSKPQKIESNAIASLILSILAAAFTALTIYLVIIALDLDLLGIIILIFAILTGAIAVALAIAGLICGIISLRKLATNQFQQGGKGIAIAAIIIASLILVSLLMVVAIGIA